MIYLRALVRRPGPVDEQAYPFSAEAIRSFRSLRFDRPVTILCGENGSGKTSLMTLLAAGLNAQVIGDSGVGAQKVRLFHKAAKRFQFVMNRRPMRCFYFTAEDFSRYLDQRQLMAQEAREGLEDILSSYDGRSDYAKSLAAQPYARTLGEMEGQYERDLLQASHGEGFLSFFAGRLHAEGLYLMDEPEGALSYANQLALLALVDSVAQAGGQVIMATHSPVLAACPNAALLEISAGGIEETSYDGLSSVQFLRHFLSHREGILRRAGIEGVLYQTPS